MALEKVALELYEALMERSREEGKGELAQWRAKHEENLKAEEGNKKSMDEFKKKYGRA